MPTSTSDSTEVAKTEAMWSDDTLGEIKSYADAMALLNEAQVEVVSTKDLGNGFEVLKDKDRLVKVPFVILDAKLADSKEYGGQFVSLYVVTNANDKFIVNDGSTGIRDQVIGYGRKLGRKPAGIVVPSGLVRSDYDRRDDNGHPVMADDGKTILRGTTYYLSES